MSGRRWTKEGDKALINGAGVFSIAWFQNAAGQSYDYPNAPLRSRLAIYRRAERVIGQGGLRRGTHSLDQAAAETGYAHEQLLRAQRALNQKWKRLSPRGPYLITFEQLEEIVGWLRGDYWCTKLRLYGCVECGSDSRPARGKGLCPRCYFIIYRFCQARGLPTKLPELRRTIEGLDAANPEVRASLQAAREHLERGWAPTAQQMRAIASLSSSTPRSLGS